MVDPTSGRRRRFLGGVGALVALASAGLLAPGGGAAAAPVGRVTVTRPAGAITPTTRSNRVAAMIDADTLLQGVVVPSGATLEASGTGRGPRTHLITEELASAVAYRRWTVAANPTDVLAYVQARLPPGSTVYATGSSEPPPSREVIRSWPPVRGVLGVRLLEIQVTTLANGQTELYAEAQSQWIVTRQASQRISADVREISITDSWPRARPFISRRLTSLARVRHLLRVFNSLPLAQPAILNCPAELVTPTVKVQFRSAERQPAVATAWVSADATPASVCSPVILAIRGHRRLELTGNVIAPIHRLLGVRLGRGRRPRTTIGQEP